MRFRLAVVVALILVIGSSGLAEVQNDRASSCKENTSLDSSGKRGSAESSLFYKKSYDEDADILKRITGEMSDSRKMGIGALLVLIGSVLYAGFNWNQEDAF